MMTDFQIKTDARPHKHRLLRIAQIAWVILVAPALVMYVAGWLIHFDKLHHVCTDAFAQCAEFDYVTPAGMEQLNAAGISIDVYAFLVAGVALLYAILPVGLGLLIFARKRNEFIGLLISFFLVTFGLAGTPLNVASDAFPQFDWYIALVRYASALSLPLFFGLFPNGRMIPRAYWLVVIMFGVLIFGGDILQVDSATNPFWNAFSFAAWLSVLVGGTAAQVYRYRRVATSEEKKQTRWVLFGLGLLVIWILSLIAYTAALGDFNIGTNRDPNILRRVMFLTMLQLAFQFIYFSISMAILRSRLFDIDIIIRKTVTYTLVVALLAIVYFGSVILLQQIFANITGQRSEVITVLSTLAIAALFVPLRNRIQDLIDKRFYRRKYDAQKVLQKFAETVRDETDLDKLTAELVNVVQETMQPKSVSVWLKREDGETGRQGYKE